MNWADYFYYDESSPSCLRWAVDVRAGKDHGRVIVKSGDVAGHVVASGNYDVGLNYKKVRVHRIVWELHFGEIPKKMVVDHIDGNNRNNHIGNLRIVTQAINSRNARKCSNNTTGINGVTWSTNSSGVLYARADYIRDGKYVTKYFNTRRMGLLPAVAAAAKFREEAIVYLNKQGAGYTERHGK